MIRRWTKYPFSLILFIDMMLIGFAAIAALLTPPSISSQSSFKLDGLPQHHPHHFPPPPGPPIEIPGDSPPPLTVALDGLGYFPWGALLCVLVLALMGLGLPLNRSWPTRIFYIFSCFALCCIAVFCGGHGEFFFSTMLLVVVARASLIFPVRGRLLAAAIAYALFMIRMLAPYVSSRAFAMFNPFPPAPNGIDSMPAPLRTMLLNLLLSSILGYSLVLIFIVLIISALIKEYQSRQQLASANAQLRQYSLLIENQAILKERNRIASEIHDSVGHFLTAQSIQLENVAMFLSENSDRATHHLKEARRLGKEALTDVRQSVANLRSKLLANQTFSEALEKLIQASTQSQDILTEVRFEVNSNVSEEIAVPLYRIVQEALTNVIKHSDANQVSISLYESHSNLILAIADNGCGFEQSQNTTGFGLQGMSERAQSLGGNCVIKSEPGLGCKILVEIPLIATQNDPDSVS